MDPLQFLVPLDWIDEIGDVIPLAIFAVVLVNMLTRYLRHRTHVTQAENGDETLSRYLPHVVSNVALVLLVFLFMLYRPISGAIMAIPVVGVFVADVFEFEARNVEARNNMPIEWPKAGIAASSIVLIYAAYYGLRFLYAPFLDLVFA
ncbi:MAG: DUF7313 family protein [Halobacteriota archaeon]